VFIINILELGSVWLQDGSAFLVVFFFFKLETCNFLPVKISKNLKNTSKFVPKQPLKLNGTAAGYMFFFSKPSFK